MMLVAFFRVSASLRAGFAAAAVAGGAAAAAAAATAAADPVLGDRFSGVLLWAKVSVSSSHRRVQCLSRI